MPGLVGFYKSLDKESAEQLIAKMSRALEPENRFQVELYHDVNLGLGRVSLGIINLQPQPVWNAEKTVCLVLEGEVYNYQAMKNLLIERGHRFQRDDISEFLLHLYLEYGEDFVKELNGAFALAIWDHREQKLLLVNDRLNLSPIYYAEVPGGIIFASGVRALLVDPSVPREVDRVALAEFLTFDHLLDDHTLLDAVRLMPQASILIYQNGHLTISPYWRVKYPDEYQLNTERELMDMFLAHMERAVSRQAYDELPAGLLLSGGLDSRMILPYLADNIRQKPLHTYTWGLPGCDDARFALEAARRVGTEHHFYKLEPDWLLSKADEAVRITDGMGNVVNMHALATLEEETQSTRVIYKGFLGDAMMGYGIMHQFWAEYDESNWVNAHLQVHTNQGVITFDREEQKKLFTKSFQDNVGDAVIDGYIAGMKRSGSRLMADQRNYFDFYQRVPRMTIKGVEVVRSRAVVRLPFCDNDLVEFSLTVQPGLRYERRLMKNAFIQAFPKLAQIPVTENGLPMMTCSRDVLIRARRVIQWHLHSMGLHQISLAEVRPYANYNQWFRADLRPWVENVLLSKQSLERGYFDPAYIRHLVDEHMSGINHTVRLGALLTIELWHKQFLD